MGGGVRDSEREFKGERFCGERGYGSGRCHIGLEFGKAEEGGIGGWQCGAQ